MELRVGARLRSAVCTTEVIIVRAGGEDLTLTCGGGPMVALAEARGAPVVARPGVENTALVGKRYRDEQSGLEILVTKAGPGPLAANGRELLRKEATKLPSSD